MIYLYSYCVFWIIYQYYSATEASLDRNHFKVTGVLNVFSKELGQYDQK